MMQVDILLIAHVRADYLSRSLPRLLDTLRGEARLWIWQNGDHPETTKVIRRHLDHPSIHRYEQSRTNVGIHRPTSWFWHEAKGALVGKVDDDCLVPDGWIETFRSAHEDAAELGIVAAWHFQLADLFRQTIEQRSVELPGGHVILQNCWVGGSGYLMKRSCVNELGSVDETRSFSDFCIDVAASGRIVGWYYPLIVQDHMDDPRSPNTMLRTDRDLAVRMPLSASRLPELSLAAWENQLRTSARTVQTASLRPRDHRGWRRKLTRIRSRLSIS